MIVNKHTPIIAWWSGGVTSAVACKIAIDIYGLENVWIVFIDTFNEDEDTYRFMSDCQKWYGKEIETISGIGEKYTSIQDTWYKHLSLNISVGATCSLRLKRLVRERWEKENNFSYQVFGFDINEPNRVKSTNLNYPNQFIYPLLLFGYNKKDCIKILEEDGVKIPAAYDMGFNNNNCLKTGCVQGGVGYWQKMQREFPEKFKKMALVEHDLTNLKGSPVTMLRDQSKVGGLVFLLPHPDYPHIKDISMMKGRPPKPLTDCNGFCGTNDFESRSETENEINYHDKNIITLFND